MGVFRAIPIVALFAGALAAQTPTFGPPPTASVGVPYSFDLFFGALQQLQQAVQNIPAGAGVPVTLNISVTAGMPPPGLTFHSSGVISGTPTTPGTFSFTVSIAFAVSVRGFSQSFNYPFPFAITVTGMAPTGPKISVAPPGLFFSFTASQGASTEAISVSNSGGTAGSYDVTTSTVSGGNWLSASAGGSAPAFGSTAIPVTANPSGLSPGAYAGKINITSGASQFSVSAVMTISSGQQLLNLSQSGLTFSTVAGGGTPAPQSFSVQNGGVGSLNWTASASTLSGGSSWLSVSPTSGSSNAGSSSSSSPAVKATVSPAGLAAGTYYGKIQIASDGVPNSPQTSTVVLTVQPASANPVDPAVSPTGLIFAAAAGAANPGAKTVTIGNLGTKAVTYSSQPTFETGSNWFTVSPSSGSVAGAQSMTVSVQPALAGLAAGVYIGDLALQFKETNSIHHVAIVLVVAPPGSVGLPLPPKGPRLASGCTPSKLIPVFTQLGQSFSTTAAWPTTVEVTAIDDCGTLMTSGSVLASFSNGDPLLPLNSLADGRWTGTWQPRNSSTTPVTITANAQQVTPPISGSASIGGNSQANTSVPIINSGGAVNAASLQENAPVGPGSFVQIQGSNLGQGFTPAGSVPLPTSLNGSQAIIAGRPMPLYFTNDGQINAIVPYDVPPNATHQLIIQRGTALSVAQNVTVAAAGPAVFTLDGSGQGPGVIGGFKAGSAAFLAGDGSPVTAGDIVAIYCTGLGPVNPPVDAGAAAPTGTLSSTTNPVTVTIGGQPATVFFSGLTPGLTGVYQVNAIVPSGVTPGDAPVVVSVAGQSSPPVTVAVE